MNKDEIKEILDNFKDYELRYKQCNENQFIIFYRDIHLLLDYITNLQTIEQQYSAILSENAELEMANKEKLPYEEIVSKYRSASELNKKYVKEIDRLNNIMNELEKYIKTEIPEDDFINSELCVNILDKLEELKEGK